MESKRRKMSVFNEDDIPCFLTELDGFVDLGPCSNNVYFFITMIDDNLFYVHTDTPDGSVCYTPISISDGVATVYLGRGRALSPVQFNDCDQDPVESRILLAFNDRSVIFDAEEDVVTTPACMIKWPVPVAKCLLAVPLCLWWKPAVALPRWMFDYNPERFIVGDGCFRCADAFKYVNLRLSSTWAAITTETPAYTGYHPDITFDKCLPLHSVIMPHDNRPLEHVKDDYHRLITQIKKGRCNVLSATTPDGRHFSRVIPVLECPGKKIVLLSNMYLLPNPRIMPLKTYVVKQNISSSASIIWDLMMSGIFSENEQDLPAAIVGIYRSHLFTKWTLFCKQLFVNSFMNFSIHLFSSVANSGYIDPPLRPMNPFIWELKASVMNRPFFEPFLELVNDNKCVTYTMIPFGQRVNKHPMVCKCGNIQTTWVSAEEVEHRNRTFDRMRTILFRHTNHCSGLSVKEFYELCFTVYIHMTMMVSLYKLPFNINVCRLVTQNAVLTRFIKTCFCIICAPNRLLDFLMRIYMAVCARLEITPDNDGAFQRTLHRFHTYSGCEKVYRVFMEEMCQEV